MINEFIIAASTADILFDLSCQEISKGSSEIAPDRMSRLVKHILEQRRYFYYNCPILFFLLTTLKILMIDINEYIMYIVKSSFYPLFPSSAQMNLNYNMQEKTYMPVAPDLLILPSQLRYMIKVLIL